MKLLFDENLSRSLCSRLQDIFPSSEHAVTAGLEHASDWELWEYAKLCGACHRDQGRRLSPNQFSSRRSAKVVWLRVGNSSTDRIENLLRLNLKSLAHLEADQDAALLIITPD